MSTHVLYLVSALYQSLSVNPSLSTPHCHCEALMQQQSTMGGHEPEELALLVTDLHKHIDSVMISDHC